MQHQHRESAPEVLSSMKSRRWAFRATLLVSFFCTGLLFTNFSARATDFIARNGAQISGEIIRFTGNTVTIRPDAGGMVILSPSDIDLVRCSLREWSPVEGRLVHWDNDAYTILTNQKIFVVKNGLLLQIADAPPEIQSVHSPTSIPGRGEAMPSKDQSSTRDRLLIKAPL